MINQTEMFGFSEVETPAPWVDPARVATYSVTRTTDTDFVNEAVEIGRMGNNREVFVVTAIGHGEDVIAHWTYAREGAACAHAEELWATLQRNKQARLAL